MDQTIQVTNISPFRMCISLNILDFQNTAFNFVSICYFAVTFTDFVVFTGSIKTSNEPMVIGACDSSLLASYYGVMDDVSNTV